MAGTPQSETEPENDRVVIRSVPSRLGVVDYTPVWVGAQVGDGGPRGRGCASLGFIYGAYLSAVFAGCRGPGPGRGLCQH